MRFEECRVASTRDLSLLYKKYERRRSGRARVRSWETWNGTSNLDGVIPPNISRRTRFEEHQRLPKRRWLLGQEIVVCLSLQESFVIGLVGHHVWHLAHNDEWNG